MVFDFQGFCNMSYVGGKDPSLATYTVATEHTTDWAPNVGSFLEIKSPAISGKSRWRWIIIWPDGIGILTYNAAQQKIVPI